MLSSQKSHGLLSEDFIIQHNQTVHLQSHPICKQLKATDLFCILGHKQNQGNEMMAYSVLLKVYPCLVSLL